MEPSPSNDRRGPGRPFLIVVAVIAVAVAGTFVAVKLWVMSEMGGVSTETRPPVEKVMRAYLWSKISGSYWEDAMEDGAHYISTLPERNRIEYFRCILINCELDTSRASTFVDLLGTDATALRTELLRLKEDPRFAKMSPPQRKRVVDWIEELKIVIEQNDASATRPHG
jgi:hypothetical protein